MTIEQVAKENKLCYSNKHPSGLNQKWSEATSEFQCSNCNSTDISSDISGDVVMIACHDCSNWCLEPVFYVFKMYDSGETWINLPDVFEEL